MLLSMKRKKHQAVPTKHGLGSTEGKKCAICLFSIDVNDESGIPYVESVKFELRKMYMQTVEHYALMNTEFVITEEQYVLKLLKLCKWRN